MFKEFKKFIARGNVMDLAVGVIIGGAFGKIVTSLVDDILMPVVAKIIGKTDFTQLSVWGINYGNFIQNVVDFLIVAFVIFLIIKAINKMNEKMEAKMKKIEEKLGKKGEAKEDEPKVPEVPEDIKLLREINEGLKKLNKKN